MADIGFRDDQQTDRRDDRQTKRQMGGPTARPEDAEVPNTTKSSGGSVLLWKGFPRGFRGSSEGFQGFHQCDPRQEMFANVGMCAESRIRGRRRRPGEQTPNIILNKESQDASSNFNTSDVAIRAWGSRGFENFISRAFARVFSSIRLYRLRLSSLL